MEIKRKPVIILGSDASLTLEAALGREMAPACRRHAFRERLPRGVLSQEHSWPGLPDPKDTVNRITARHPQLPRRVQTSDLTGTATSSGTPSPTQTHPPKPLSGTPGRPPVVPCWTEGCLEWAELGPSESGKATTGARATPACHHPNEPVPAPSARRAQVCLETSNLQPSPVSPQRPSSYADGP